MLVALDIGCLCCGFEFLGVTGLLSYLSYLESTTTILAFISSMSETLCMDSIICFLFI